MINNKEAYINYLVRKVSEGVNEVFSKKMKEMKSELVEYDYEMSLYKTEEVLKNYRKLKKHIELADFNKIEFETETKELYDEELERMMTEVFKESETHLKTLLRSKYKTKAFINFIDRVIKDYLETDCEDELGIRKRKILKEIYINGTNQSEFILNNYINERTFYRDRTKLIKDLAPYFFGIKGIEV